MRFSFGLLTSLFSALVLLSAVSAAEPPEDETGYFAQASGRWSSVSTEPTLFLPVSELPESELQQRERFYYLYLFPSQLSPSTLRPEFRQKFKEWDEAIWQERQLRAARGERYDLAEYVCAKDEKWLDAEQWDAAEFYGATLSDQRCLTVEEDDEALDVVYGLPISFEALKQTPTWRTKRLLYTTLKFHSLDEFSFKDWKITKSTLSIKVPSSCDLSGAQLENAEFRGPFTCRQILSTANYKDKTFNELKLWMKESEIPDDWRYEAWTKYDPVTGTVDISRKPTRALSVNELSELYYVSIGAPKEEFYKTSKYQTGRLANFVFQPDPNDSEKNSMKGWDLSRQDLTNAKFCNLDLTDVNFTDSVITCCSFAGSKGLTLEQLKSTWNWRVGRMDDVLLPSELREEVDRAFAQKK